jgi:hypothetical protein
MSAKDVAIRDMLPELESQNKCFLAFKKELNPAMRKLVRNQLREQRRISNPHHHRPSKASSQLVAHCFFSKSDGTVMLNNYTKYYRQ